MHGGRIRHRIWRLGRLASSCLIAAGLSLVGAGVGVGVGVGTGQAALAQPGLGSNIPGGITTIDGQLWVAGVYDDGGSEMPLIEHR